MQVNTMMCGSCANENAFKLLYFRYMDRQRGGRDFTEEELQTALYNKPPGTLVVPSMQVRT